MTETPWQDAAAPPYPPRLYEVCGAAEPVNGLDAVDEGGLRRFEEQGFLAVEHALSPEEVRAALDGLHALIDGSRPDFPGLQFEAGMGERLASASLEEKLDGVRKFWRFVEYEPRLKALAEHPGILGLVRRMLGAEPELLQDMALVKPPRVGREKPWHQDAAYFNLPLGTPVVGVWIALDEATADNGCMRVLPGSHQEGPVVHFNRRDWQICDDQVPRGRAVAVPLEPGGCLFFHSLLHHGTPANHTSERRRAIQFHYRPARAPSITTEERLAVFGSEGKDVSC